jgi:hypothetical protein
MIPREHGAWVMIILPFVAAALAAGDWQHLRTLAAFLAVLALFLLRLPLLWLTRSAVECEPRPAAEGAAQPHGEIVRRSLLVYGLIALLCALHLISTLPWHLLVAAAAAPIILLAATLHPWLQQRQHAAWFEIGSVPALTSSALTGYLAASGALRLAALLIWLLFTVQLGLSVLAVRAHLNFSTAAKSTVTPRAGFDFYRAAVVGELVLWTGLVVSVFLRAEWAWLGAAFLVPSVWHGWILWRLRSGGGKLALRVVGLLETAVSVVFLIFVSAKL